MGFNNQHLNIQTVGNTIGNYPRLNTYIRTYITSTYILRM